MASSAASYPQPSAPSLSLYPTIANSQQQAQQVVVAQAPRELALVIGELIIQAHLPDVAEVTDGQRREMALKMRSLREILVGCEAAKPKLFSNVKRFSHPSPFSKGKCEIQNLFEILTRIVKVVKTLKGGVELFHLGEGIRIVPGSFD